jgi:Xaa-Pro aminopeptidase
MQATVDSDRGEIANALSSAPPFDTQLLDRLMEDAGLDLLLISSKHNIAYMLGGYRFFFFDMFDAIGTSRYLPIIVYQKGRPDRTIYVANAMESYEQERGRFWVPTVKAAAWTTRQSMDLALAHIRSLGVPPRRIGVEVSFIPGDAMLMLQAALPDVEISDALYPMERLRARKSANELDWLREASERVIASMQAVFASHGPGSTKRELTDALKREEIARDLAFDYCLIATGGSHNRAPSEERWREGEILSLDSGGNYKGYIGDLCRMAILGEPDGELVDILGEIEALQQQAREPIRAGAIGKEIYAAVSPLLARSAHRGYMSFVAHGMGMIAHEAPRLTSEGPVPYADEDADKPLESGMVISVETTIHHPRRGFIKLEDTIAVTSGGHEAFGDAARGWNRGGQPSRTF